jgi:FdhD protein
MIVSRTAPTTLSIEIAEKMNMTVVGFVRGFGMKFYTYPERLGLIPA